MPGVDALGNDEIREALRLYGIAEVPTTRGAAQRLLRETLQGFGTVRQVLEHAPPGARDAFVRLATSGPAPVEDILGRGWWGRGALPPPLDWLQVRALVIVADDGLLHALDEARTGFSDLRLELEPAVDVDAPVEPVHVEAVGCVVVASSATAIAAAANVPAASLRVVAPTVAVSTRSATAVTAALRSAGVRLDVDLAVTANPEAPALPGATEDAVGPRSIRALLKRAVDEQRQVHLEYFASSRGGVATERTVDPWRFADDLLTGYCHLRSGERTFAVDRIGRARLLPSALEHLAP